MRAGLVRIGAFVLVTKLVHRPRDSVAKAP